MITDYIKRNSNIYGWWQMLLAPCARLFGCCLTHARARLKRGRCRLRLPAAAPPPPPPHCRRESGVVDERAGAGKQPRRQLEDRPLDRAAAHHVDAATRPAFWRRVLGERGPLDRYVCAWAEGEVGAGVCVGAGGQECNEHARTPHCSDPALPPSRHLYLTGCAAKPRPRFMVRWP